VALWLAACELRASSCDATTSSRASHQAAPLVTDTWALFRSGLVRTRSKPSKPTNDEPTSSGESTLANRYRRIDADESIIDARHLLDDPPA
jgi:hypothetical protein